MSNYSSLNSTNRDNITSVNGTAESSVASINEGIAIPDGNPDWVVGLAGSTAGKGRVGYAFNSDRTSWTTTAYTTTDQSATFSVAYGKNAAGEGIYIAVQRIDSPSHQNQLAVSGVDITDGSLWTEVSLVASSNANNTVQKILWAADSGGSTAGVWMAGTGNGQLFRSTDGAANWSELTKGAGQLPTNWETTGGDQKIVRSMASNGSGQWVVIQDARIFVSTNDGATFSEVSHGISNVNVFLGIVYTNNSYVVTYDRDDDDKIYARSASSSDLTSWSSQIDYSPIKLPGTAGQIKHVRMAANNAGRVVFVVPDRSGVGFLDVNGTTVTNNGFGNNDTSRITRDIATNGDNVWLITCEDGEIYQSTDNGANFTRIIHEDITGDDTNINCIAASVYLPI